MNIVLCESSDRQSFRAEKARKDALQIAEDAGYHHVRLFHSGDKKWMVPFEMAVGCIRTIMLAGKGDDVFVQYPYYPAFVNKMFYLVLGLGKKLKKYTVTVLIHDVVSLRSGITEAGERAAALRKELNVISCADKIICHNHAMHEQMRWVAPKHKYVELGPFDYLYRGSFRERTYQQTPYIIVAGNLSKAKCGYIYGLNSVKNVRFRLYGADYDGESSETVAYMGKYPQDELIENLDGQYGLVWDGDSFETCHGSYGEYLRYNDPFKFSMYLAAGLPVIVWKESALAEYVEKVGIGICVNSLTELSDFLGNVCEEKYIHMCENVMRFRDDIITGNNLKKILKSK